jgi:hypothetical protein
MEANAAAGLGEDVGAIVGAKVGGIVGFAVGLHHKERAN